jgi:hypothetical protein
MHLPATGDATGRGHVRDGALSEAGGWPGLVLFVRGQVASRLFPRGSGLSRDQMDTMRLQRHDLTFPRLDLPASHITAMSLSATLDVPLERDLPDDGMFELFIDPSVSFYTAMAYRKSGMTHFVSA